MKNKGTLNIIGISALYHDSACCLMQDGVVTAASHEERFTRKKFDPAMPYHAFMYCLEETGLNIIDIDCIAYYENPRKKLARQLWSGHNMHSGELNERFDPQRAEREIREILGYEGTVKYFEHHQSHAASSYYFSGFDEAAILTVDGVGEWATSTYGIGKQDSLEIVEEVHFPDSLGLLYSTITGYLGFKVNSGEYKVMGLAPYGNPIYTDKIRSLLKSGEKGCFYLDMEYFDFLKGEKMYSDALAELFGQPPRVPESTMDQFHKDVAKSLQCVLEEILLEKANYLHKTIGSENLCMAGGVALNCVANGRILREGPFKNLFVQPAANDAGCALGAAALAHVELAGKRPQHKKMEHVYLGDGYSNDEIARVLNVTSLKYKDFRGKQDQLISETAKRLEKGKVIGWYQGKMEFGPRALGSRSILADPRGAEMRDRINAMVKKREAFRPFAPVVLEDKMREHFDIDHPSPFMLETCRVISSLDLPAITHVNGSARIQSVNKDTNYLYAAVIEEFERLTGCPILLNTSFNVRGEPIVRTPIDAMQCFITTDIECLVLGDFIIDREEQELAILQLMINSQREANAVISHDVYTFI
ncbi:MAG: carbamoyltransferase [bacterium]|nr:carbamoyltransferase [bacterium]